MASIASLLAEASLPGSTSAKLDAELLLARVLDKPRSFLMTWPELEPTADQIERFAALLARRQAGEPVAYLLGRQGFWNLDLGVSPATLIPRPDTERLVEVALELGPQGRGRVLDLGTGSGAIALALASERPAWRVTGSDLVPAAVELAETNRRRLALDNVTFLQSDWFAAFTAADAFDLIVSNPPYIAEDDPHLVQGDLRFEPRSALTSGADGLDAIRQLVTHAPGHLAAGGWLLFEHGWQQAAAVGDLLTDRGFVSVGSWSDLAGHLRVTGGQWNA